jgi:acetyl esterase/lipase
MHHHPLFLFGPLAAFALALSVIGPARAEVFLDPIFGVNVTSDIVYGTGQIGHPDNLRDVDLMLDVYQPIGAGLPELLPSIVLIHGGAFSAGDKSDMSGLATEFASRGYVATSIQYRLFGDFVSHPPPAPYTLEGISPLLTAAIHAAFVDAVKGVNWLRDSANDLNVDTDRIIIGGFSAGATTSLVVGMAHNNSESLFPGVEVAGILDMSGGLRSIGLVGPADPATYIVHGRQDGAYVQATGLASALTAAGVPVGFPLIDGFHEFEPLLNTDLGNGHLVIDDMFGFFHDQLVIPEPSSTTLLAAVAIGGLMLYRRRWPVV